MLQQWRKPMELIRHGQAVLVNGHSMDGFVLRQSIGVAAAVVVVSVGVETNRSSTLFYNVGLKGWELGTPTRCLVVPLFCQERRRVFSNLCYPPFLRLRSMKLLCHVYIRERETEQVFGSLERDREQESYKCSVNGKITELWTLNTWVRTQKPITRYHEWLVPFLLLLPWFRHFNHDGQWRCSLP